jgi:membrane associated rhomboid family serine protease
MGIGDRHYNRPDEPTYRPARPRGSGGAGDFFRAHFDGAKITRNLIILNCAIFVLGMVIFDWARTENQLVKWGAFIVDDTINGLQLWRLVTSQFLHSSPRHLLGNMIAFFFFGPIVERWLGSRRYLAFCLLCGFAALVLAAICQWTGWLKPFAANGASGQVYGVLMAAAVVAPDARVLFMMIIPISMRWLAIGYIAVLTFGLMSGGGNRVTHLAHLGGAVAGFVLIKMPWLLAWARHIPIGSASGHLTSPSGGKKGNGEGFFARRANQAAQNAARSKREALERDEAEVNRILDKVKAEGMYTLTDKEKATLQRATDRQRGQG